MASRCNFCGENAVISTSDGPSVSMRVCQECGSVDDEHFIAEETPFTRQFDNTSTIDFTQTLSRSARHALWEATPQGLKLGRNRIKILGQTFKLGASLIDDAGKLYERLFKHPDVIHKTISNKMLLAAACVYVMMRQNNMPVPMRWFCKVSDISVNEFSSNFLLVLKSMNISLVYPSIGSCIADLLSPAGLSSKVISLTSDIIQLCEKAWIVSGRSHSPIIIAASHIAWYTLNEDKGKKSSLKDYCKEFKFHFSGAVADRSKEIHNTIFELGKTLPWVISNYQDKKFFNRKYLVEIVKYKESLLHSHRIEGTEKPVCVVQAKDTLLNIEDQESHGSSERPAILTDGTSPKQRFLTPSTQSSQEISSKSVDNLSLWKQEEGSHDQTLAQVQNCLEKNENFLNKNVSSEFPKHLTTNSACISSTKNLPAGNTTQNVHVVVYESDPTLQKNLYIPPSLKKAKKRVYYEAFEDLEGLNSDDELTEAQERDVDRYIRSDSEVRVIKQFEEELKSSEDF